MRRYFCCNRQFEWTSVGEYNLQMLRYYALDVDDRKNVTRFAIELFLQELAEQLHAPDEWQKAAANDAIAAFHRGEYEHALTCIDVGETPPDQRSPLSTFTEEERGLSLCDLWRRFACARSVPVPASSHKRADYK